MKKELLFIHHSHTDIGYTERQEKITRYHVDFIKQAIEICNKIEKGIKPEWEGFRWVCENTWQVEQFLQNASEQEKEDFKYFLNKGYINISGNYLNMTELLDADILTEKIRRGVETVSTYGKKPVSAMTADINGYAWGYADSLYDNGIEHLFSCIHTHHGMYPLNKKQNAFYWESPKGNKVLTWVGDMYYIGNDVCFAPLGGNSYNFRGDDMENYVYTDTMKVAETRIFRYLDELKKDGYEFSFVPFTISGVMTDNAPPNGKIMEFIHSWNEKHGDDTPARMVSLDEFFEKLKNESIDIPTYRGDWNDWWADGVGSTMAAVKNFREGQRNYQLANKLANKNIKLNEELKKEVEDQLLLYAEHTWGYSSSVSEPWATLVNDLDLRKTGHSIQGTVAAAKNLDILLEQKGAVSISTNHNQQFKIINPHEEKMKDTVKLFVDFWECIEGKPAEPSNFDNEIEIVDEEGRVYPSQSIVVARGIDVEVLVELDAKEERLLSMKRKEQQEVFVPKRKAVIGAEGVRDIVLYEEMESLKNSLYQVRTEYFTIMLDEEIGIQDILDNADQKSILNAKCKHKAFSGIYERTPIQTDPYMERRLMGRNRKSPSTKRFVSKVKNISKVMDGDLFTTIAIAFELEGTEIYEVHIKAYYQLPKLDFSVRLHKTSSWNPENLYLSLPFSTNETEELWLEKSGCVIRPGIDQLPYSNTEFYLLQDGLAYISNNKTLQIALKDVPLVTLGNLESHPIVLADKKEELQHQPLYSWVMNNFWETNFKVDLSGFYEFDYSVKLQNQSLSPKNAIKNCKEVNQGLIGIRVK
ncbi:glycosyl hydrolase [Pseudalkalibacillus sp. A8]|uniref:glycoside hydrolase family 38 N-terminal domain-containing protein n=1 Tax=Pseudalkalibacillus sp. A8 TaxID=3382641 RepID=UPI0038B4BF8F